MGGRSRIIRIKDKIIITNYKCMFSSINKLKISELNPKDSKKYEKIFLFRNPYIRTISCFLNWFITYPVKILNLNKKQAMIDQIRDSEKWLGWLIELLLKEPDFNYDNYKVLLKENNIIELFKIYIEFLPKIKHKDGHMHSQVKIVKDNKFNIDTFINIDKEEDVKKLEKKVMQDIIKCNVSKCEYKQLCIFYK